MNTSTVSLLVRKDFMLSRRMILVFCAVALGCAGVVALLSGRVPAWALVNLGLVLLISPAVTCGIVLLMTSVVFEKEKATQAFIMSLPVTPAQFTLAKLLLNVGVFGAFWLAIGAIAFGLAFGQGLFPAGTLPFAAILFLGVFLAYVGILCVALWRQSLGLTVLAIAVFEMGTSAYLWIVAYLEPVGAHLRGAEAVWNPTVLAILAVQGLLAAGLLAATLAHQRRKGDFL